MYKNILLIMSILAVFGTIITSCSDDSTSPDSDTTINLLFPDGGDSLIMGNSYDIAWENYTDTLNIEFYKGADSNIVKVFEFTDVASNGEFEFTVPADLEIGDDYKVKIVSVIDSTIYDESDDYFSILSINLLYPNGGNTLVIGNPCVIAWENYTDTLNIEFYKGIDSNAVKVFELRDVVSIGEFELIIPTNLEIGDDYKVKIVSVIDSTICDESDNYFSISNINLLFPNGGTNLVIGDSHIITWENYTDTLNIEFYKGEGINAVKVFEFTDVVGSGEYEFTVSTDFDIGDDYKVKIVSVLDSIISDQSDDYFSISNIVTGKWNVQGTWSKWDGIWEFFNDGTFTNSWGTSGTWLLVDNVVTWEYATGTFYTGVIEDDTMSGVIDGGLELTGTWSAQRIIE